MRRVTIACPPPGPAPGFPFWHPPIHHSQINNPMPHSSHFPNGIIFVADHPFSAASVTEAPASRPAADDGRHSYNFRKESDYAFVLVRSSLQRDELQQTLEVEVEPIELSADLAFPLSLINPDKGFFRQWFRDDSGVEG
jgi:hypothetical protein